MVDVTKRSAAQVLRACQVLTLEGIGEPSPCGEPGKWWTAPSGNTYAICEEHLAVFESERGEQ